MVLIDDLPFLALMFCMFTSNAFEGKKVLITGGTRGIGAQIAKDFRAFGANVKITGRTNFSTRRDYYCVDFSDDKGFMNFLQAIKTEDYDILINNVGINQKCSVDKVSHSMLDQFLTVNLKRAFQLITVFSEKWKLSGTKGKIVNIASIASEQAIPERSLYTVTKFGLNGLTKAVAVELASAGIMINSVSPGPIFTDMTLNMLNEDEIKEAARRIPVGRFGYVEEVSGIVLFLTSDMNSYITGQNIIVDGGLTSQWTNL
jgi:3-oxoacyl-[acyl-carrier protein] reductase